MTGAVDSKTMTLSFWIRVLTDPGPTAAVIRVAAGSSFRLRFDLNPFEGPRFLTHALTSINGDVVASSFSDNIYGEADDWFHFIWAIDAANAKSLVYIKNASEFASPVVTDALIQFAGFVTGGWGLAAIPIDDGNKINAEFSEIWFSQEFVDISDAANRAKFIDSVTLKPVGLGADGSTPTGTAPLFYYPDGDPSEDASGNSNDMTITGALVSVAGPGA